MTTSKEDAYKKVFGWFRDETAASLDRLIAEYKIKDVVEIGSFVGRSALFFAARVEQVCCIDPFVAWEEGQQNGDARSFGGDDFYSQFLANTAEFSNITPIRMTSNTADYCWSKVLKSDLVYIDGAHDYESVKLDIKLFTPRANKIICGDDYDENWPGVVQAVDEAFPDRIVEGNFWYKII